MKPKKRSMASILLNAKKAAKGKRFIEFSFETITERWLDYKKINVKEKVFNYGRFTEYCQELAQETNDREGGIIIRDIALESIDKTFNRNVAHTFRGMDCIS